MVHITGGDQIPLGSPGHARAQDRALLAVTSPCPWQPPHAGLGLLLLNL
ncbi:hypothetical protein AB0J43_01995 [Nonomuraea fuscirosea]